MGGMDTDMHPLVAFLTHARDAGQEVELTLSSGAHAVRGVPTGVVWAAGIGMPSVVMRSGDVQCVVMLGHVAVASEPTDDPTEEERP